MRKGSTPRISALDKRRLRQVKPENAGKVVSHDIYWSQSFLHIFLERCDAVAFEVPADAHKMAIHAPSLADIIGVGNREGEYPSDRVKRTYRVRARATFASTCFRIGKITEAGAEYQRAVALCQDGPIDLEAEADLLMRLGNYQTNTRQPGDLKGLTTLNRALEILDSDAESDEETDCLRALALVLRGSWHQHAGNPEYSALDYAQAIAVSAPINDPRAKRAQAAAYGNLARLLAFYSLSSMDHDRALALIQQGRKRLGRAYGSAIRMQLCWIEGTLYRRLHLDRKAEKLLRKARDGFRELEMPTEFLVVSLDLAMLYLQFEDRVSLEELRSSTVKVLSSPDIDPVLLEIAESWSEKVRRDGLERISQTVTARLRSLR